MTNFTLERGAGFKVMAEGIKLLQEAGMLPAKIGFLAEPRNDR